jgi:hypothetical protein
MGKENFFKLNTAVALKCLGGPLSTGDTKLCRKLQCAKAIE